ncbi:MAG: insulinase family protein [Bdellovibrionaceae bacterium]|nr:insulinase family protein [Pseudobdellovibrionaceae bacterium]
MSKNSSFFFFLISFLASTLLWAQTKPNARIQFSVVKYTLPNGLTVILHADNSLPLISYHTWYKVGSRDEYAGVTGAAHMLEHMMFKGSKRFPGNDYDRILHENGITNNAFTSYDYTGFYQSLPSSKLDLMMQLEVDRMSQLLLREEDLKTERDVVKEERRWRIDNNPVMALFELTMATVFKTHNYKNPVIGTMEDISNFNVATLRKFHETFYVPNNAVLVIAGDIKISEVKKLIEKYYGPLVRKDIPERNYKKEPPQTVQYNARLKKDVKAESFNLVFQSVPQNHPDSYALDLICTILGTGSSSRLHKRLVYSKEMATSADCSHYNLMDQGVLNIHVSLKPGIEMNEPLNLVYNEIYMLRNTPIKEAELEKSKTLAIKSHVDSLRTLDNKARLLASAEISTGNYETLFTDIEKIQNVTLAEIQSVAAKYLNQQQRSIVSLSPKK